VLARLFARAAPCVLSTGAGPTFQPQTDRSGAGVAVWLRADPGPLWQQVRAGRPLLRTANRERPLYEVRVPLYALADISLMDAAPIHRSMAARY
jgi:hypothetical protein